MKKSASSLLLLLLYYRRRLVALRFIALHVISGSSTFSSIDWAIYTVVLVYSFTLEWSRMAACFFLLLEAYLGWFGWVASGGELSLSLSLSLVLYYIIISQPASKWSSLFLPPLSPLYLILPLLDLSFIYLYIYPFCQTSQQYNTIQ